MDSILHFNDSIQWNLWHLDQVLRLAKDRAPADEPDEPSPHDMRDLAIDPVAVDPIFLFNDKELGYGYLKLSFLLTKASGTGERTLKIRANVASNKMKSGFESGIEDVVLVSSIQKRIGDLKKHITDWAKEDDLQIEIERCRKNLEKANADAEERKSKLQSKTEEIKQREEGRTTGTHSSHTLKHVESQRAKSEKALDKFRSITDNEIEQKERQLQGAEDRLSKRQQSRAEAKVCLAELRTAERLMEKLDGGWDLRGKLFVEYPEDKENQGYRVDLVRFEEPEKDKP